MNVTLDTNVIGPLSCPELYQTCPDMPSVDVMREWIRNKKINAFISEGSMSLEAISNDERVDSFLRQWASRNYPITLPDPAPERKRVFSEAINLGIKILHAPRIALGAFFKIQPEAWGTDQFFSTQERLDRFSSYIRNQPHTGSEKLKELGEELVTVHSLSTAHLSHLSSLPSWPKDEQLMWMNGLLAEYDSPKKFPTRKKFLSEFRDLVAECFDLDIQASHFAYGNEYLCTFDSAKNAGTDGIMHPTQRATNSGQFGIRIVSPAEFVKVVRHET